jgi:hypothetical protein
VDHNLGELWLYGENGDDRFVQQAFLVDLNEVTPPSSNETDLNLDGGAGSNQYQLGDPGPIDETRYVYLKNNRVHINGGAGNDTYVVTGTPLADIFIITSNFLLGGGLNTDFTDIENLEIDSGGGNDQIYVLGSPSTMKVTVLTGSGEDTVHVGGDAPALKYAEPGHYVTPDPVLRQDMNRIYPIHTVGAQSGTATYPTFSFIPPFVNQDLVANIHLDSIQNNTAWYSWYIPSGAYWSTVRNWIIRDQKNAYLNTDSANRNWQSLQTVPGYNGYSYQSGTSEDAYLSGVFNNVQQNSFKSDWVWDGHKWNEHQQVFYTSVAGYTLPQTSYINFSEYGYKAPYAFSLPSTFVAEQQYYIKLPTATDLTGVHGPVEIDGGSSVAVSGNTQTPHQDTLIVHNETGVNTTGSLTDDHVYGMGMSSAGIKYINFEKLDIRLSSHNDNFTVDGSGAGTTDLVLGDGDDQVTVNATSGALNILGGNGADTAHVVGSSATGMANMLGAIDFQGNADRFDTQVSTGIFNSVAAIGTNGLAITEQIPFTELGTYIYTDAAIFDQSGKLNDSQTDRQNGHQRFGSDGRTPLLQTFTVMRSRIKTSVQEIKRIVTNNVIRTDSANDQLIVDNTAYSGAAQGQLTDVSVTGIGMVRGVTYSQVETATVSLGGGNDDFTVISTSASTTSIVNTNGGNDALSIRSISGPFSMDAGSGNDTINVGSNAPGTGGNVYGITNTLTVVGGAGTDQLNVDNTADTLGKNGTLSSTQISGLGAVPAWLIVYQTLENVVVNLGSGNDTFTVQSTHSGSTTVRANSGTDIINVQSISGPTSAIGGAGADTINVGTGIVDGIQAVLTIDGQSDNDIVNINDNTDANPNTGSLTAQSVSGLGMDPNGRVDYISVETLNVNLGTVADVLTVISTFDQVTNINGNSGNDVINVRSTKGPLNINAGSGDDTLNFGSSANGTTASPGSNSGGNVNAIAGAVVLDGQGNTDTLNIDDTSDATANSANITTTQITGLGMTVGITYAGLESINISTGSAADTLNVISTLASVTTTLNSGLGANIINLGSNAPAQNGTLNNIAGKVVLNGQGNDTANLGDTADIIVNTGTLTDSTIRDLGMGSGVDYTSIETLNINLGSGSDTFNIQSSSGVTLTTLRTGAGNNTINLGSNAPAISGNLNSISGKVVVQGEGASDTLNLDDTGDGVANTGNLTSTRITGLGMAADDVNKGVEYHSVETLNLNLGSGDDIFTIQSTHQGTTNLDLGPGLDKLTITAVSGPTNVYGNTGNDRLVVNQVVTASPAFVMLDGQAGYDTFIINYASAGSSDIRIRDTGTDPAEVDALKVNGTAGFDFLYLK